MRDRVFSLDDQERPSRLGYILTLVLRHCKELYVGQSTRMQEVSVSYMHVHVLGVFWKALYLYASSLSIEKGKNIARQCQQLPLGILRNKMILVGGGGETTPPMPQAVISDH